MFALYAAMALAVANPSDAVMIEFSADWCGYCRQMEATVARLERQGFPIRKVNFDRQRELARQFNVQSLPCFVVVVDGKEVDRIEGAASQAALEGLFARAGVRVAPSKQPPTNRSLRGQSPDADAQGSAARGETSGSLAARAKSRAFPRQIAEAPELFDDRDPKRQPDAAIRRPASRSRERDPVFEHSLAASVRLKIADPDGASTGSGTIIDAREGEALILTCGHIFRDSKGKGAISVDTFGNRPESNLAGELIAYDLDCDVALVAIRPSERVAVARIASADSPPRKGDRVLTVGCAHGADPTVRQSRIVAVNKYVGPPNVQVAGQPEQGRSGGGLFDENGWVIGVCNAADPADDEGLFASLPAIHAELKEAGLLEVCLDGTAEGIRLASSDPPAMPARMPRDRARNLPPGAMATSDESYDESDAASEGVERSIEDERSAEDRIEEDEPAPGELRLRDDEQAVLDEIDSRGDDAEVICIVRSSNSSDSKSEIIVLDRASPEFVERLSSRGRKVELPRKSRSRAGSR